MHAQARLYYTHLYNDIGVAASIERAYVCVCARVRAWVLACVFVCEEKGFTSGQEGYKPNFK